MTPSLFDARLAEIDDRLRAIQTGLADDRDKPAAPRRAEPRAERPRRPAEPRADLPPRPAQPRAELPPRPAEPRADFPPRLAELPPRVELPRLTGEPAIDLIAELRALAATQERLLTSLRELAQIPASGAADARSDVVAVSVGPLESTGALRAFERALSALAGVRAVRVRGYEGGDRALLDVHLT